MSHNTKYKKCTTNEHVRLRTGMHLGAKDPQPVNEWIFSKTENGYNISNEEIVYSPALYKAIDEIVVNSIDHFTRTKTFNSKDRCTKIECSFNKENGEIQMWNNGCGISIKKYENEDYYIPEMIFSHTMTSSNFDDEKNSRITGGLNGYGAKLTNICSEEFIIETVDTDGNYYYQKFYDGNNKKTEPVIKKTKDKCFTRITFKLDYKFFYGHTYNEELGDVLDKLIHTRMIFTSIFCQTASVKYNDEVITLNSIQKLSDILNTENKPINAVLESPDSKYNLQVSINICNITKNKQNNISIINGICVKSGGSHIKYIEKIILNNLKDKIAKTIKNTKISNTSIFNNILLVITGYIENPDWKGQQKDELNMKASYFSNYTFDAKIYTKLWSMLKPVVENIYQHKEQKDMSKTDGKKAKHLNIPHLEDATYAQTNKSHECKLILTEGLSASTFAISGLKQLGRERYGVFPLRGKLLNVRDANAEKINKNEEITNIKKIIGLQHNVKYESLKSLRYGSIIVLTDADHDGAHIKGLIVNMIHHFWPELIGLGFVTSLVTPIVKAIKNKEEIRFYSLQEYEEWKGSNNVKSYKIKYYKGLGTSEKDDAIYAFKRLDSKLLNYIEDDKTDSSMELGFSKKFANKRKDWLADYKQDNVIDVYNLDKMEVSISDLINKELIHFSQYDNVRSIPSLIDGLKPSQRKILYTALKTMKPTSEYKVAQFGAKVAELTDYHHGENSIMEAIVTMSQTYVGSNNCNLFLPIGNFGTRLFLGKDSAAARYIFTNLSPVARKLFVKEDEYIIEYKDSEGMSIEPEYYVPVLPIILLNGSLGIGTGFSTSIPQFNIVDVANVILDKLNKRNSSTLLIPYYRFFTGDIYPIQKDTFVVNGTYKLNGKELIIDEIPIGMSIDNYQTILKTMIENKVIDSYKNDSNESIAHFTIKLSDETSTKIQGMDKKKILDFFKLSKTILTSNMHLFNRNNEIKKYESVNQIINEFYDIRYEFYQKRKDYIVMLIQQEMILLENKARFIKYVNDDKLPVRNAKQDLVDSLLLKYKFDKIENSYNYLTDLPIKSLILENVKKLEAKLKEKREELDKITNTSIEKLWSADIKSVIEEYNKYNLLVSKNLNK